MLKKFTSLIIFTTLFIFSMNPRVANGSEKTLPNCKYADLGYDDMVKYSLESVDVFFDYDEIEVDEILPILDINNICVGYSVSFKCDRIPYGYMNFNFTHKNPISDFSIGEKVGKFAEEYFGYYEDINTIYYYGHGQYSLEEPNDALRVYLNSVGSTIYPSMNIFRPHFGAGETLQYIKYTSKYNAHKSIIPMGYIIGMTGQYACGVLAMTEVAYQENKLYDNYIDTTYNYLWDASDTYVNGVHTGTYNGYTTTYYTGSTYTDGLDYGMQSLSSEIGSQCTVDSLYNPQISFFSDAFTANESAILSYWLFVGTESSYEVQGHSVNAFGYCQTSHNDQDIYYLIVADGWQSTSERYVNYSDTDFYYTHGIRYDFN